MTWKIVDAIGACFTKRHLVENQMHVNLENNTMPVVVYPAANCPVELIKPQAILRLAHRCARLLLTTDILIILIICFLF